MNMPKSAHFRSKTSENFPIHVAQEGICRESASQTGHFSPTACAEGRAIPDPKIQTWGTQHL
jgi:hypothetical protein